MLQRTVTLPSIRVNGLWKIYAGNIFLNITMRLRLNNFRKRDMSLSYTKIF
jgi:hypothetical protein